VSTFLAHGVTDAQHQQAPPGDTAEEEVARLKLQEQSSRLEISDLCAALQNAQKEARWERKAMQQHAKRQQARLLLEEKCAHFKALFMQTREDSH
jgi:TorA maturation chaperone TorD